MEIKASVNIFEGGVEESVNFSIRDRYNRGRNFNINFKMTRTPVRVRVLNISNESYDYMTSKECPEWSKRAEWLSMSKKKRFESHLNRIAHDCLGKVMDYEVFND